MKALQVLKYGKAFDKTLEFREVPIPQTDSGQLLIEVYSASINPADYKIMAGAAKRIHKSHFPYTLGFDLAGKVVHCDQNSAFSEGDAIYTKLPWHQMGALAEYVVVDEEMVAAKPKNMTFEQAASIPLVACTALDAFDFAQLDENERILIIGGSGGVGTFAIQYAKHLGLHVSAISSAKNHPLLKQLGADEVLDYAVSNFLKSTEQFDAVLDLVGKSYPPNMVQHVKDGGKLISIAWHLDTETLRDLGIGPILKNLNEWRMASFLKKCQAKHVTYKHIFSYPTGAKLDKIRKWIEEEKIMAVVDKIYPFEDAIKALEHLRTERAKGKIVINIKKES